jgi:hypothetical protein
MKHGSKLLYDLFFQRPPTEEEVRAGLEFVGTFQPEVITRAEPLLNARGGRGRGAPAGQQRGARGQGLVQGGRGRGAAPVVRLPLTGWQEYAHALLLTNEAAFVN